MDGIPLNSLIPPHFVPVTSQRNISSFCMSDELMWDCCWSLSKLSLIKITLSYVMLQHVEVVNPIIPPREEARLKLILPQNTAAFLLRWQFLIPNPSDLHKATSCSCPLHSNLSIHSTSVPTLVLWITTGVLIKKSIYCEWIKKHNKNVVLFFWLC